jgi:predicted transcriptional regulator
VVHADGRLAGLVLPESLPSGAESDPLEMLRVGEVMTTDVPHEDETAKFAALREFFTRDSRPVIVIVRAGRPTGLVTPDNLAALSTPLSTETFATAECLPGSQGLLVPDLRPLEMG